MIFAKLFGAFRQEPDDPPTHAPAPQPRRVNQAAGATGTHRALGVGPKPVAPKLPPRADDKQDGASFDPYNSGAFKKSSAWERVNRR